MDLTGQTRLGTRRDEIRELLRLGAPAAATQLGAMLMGVVDTMMLGRLGVAEMDAAALGNLWIFGTLVFAMGILQGMDPIVAQAWGAQDYRRVGLSLHHGMVTALVCTVPVTASWLAAAPALRALGQTPALAELAQQYVTVQLPTIAPFLLFFALRQHLQGQGIVAPALWVMLLGNLFNLVVNPWFIWGGLGVPPMGLDGAALATSLTRVMLLVALGAWVLHPRFRPRIWMPLARGSFAPAQVGEIWRLGVPAGIQFGLEVWAFQITTLWAGRLGELPLGGHVIVMNLATLSFMIPLGISIGAATRVGHLLGRGQGQAAQQSAYIALGLGASVMLASALAFAFGRTLLPRIYTDDPAVIAVAAGVLPIAAAFQLFDGTQVVGSGVLRGMGATVPAAVINALGYYALALPLGWWLTFGLQWGLPGLWWGQSLGVAIIAVALVAWIRRRGPASVAPDAPHSR